MSGRRTIHAYHHSASPFPDGFCAAYYPETNPLVPPYAHDPLSFTPPLKAIPIRIERSFAKPEGV